MMRDSGFMQMALALAREAGAAGEVPVGAVVVKDGRVIATGRNAPIERRDPSAHAEMVAMRAAAIALGNYRLDGCELFVTLEPCAMCSGAMLHARLSRVVFGATDPKTGAAGSVLNLFAITQLNHQTQVLGGVLGEACAGLLQDFFQNKRDEKAHQRRALMPLRDDALRTPDTRFAGLQEYPWQPRYISDLATLAGLRMHFVDEGPPAGPLTFLCLHGNMTWSYSFRRMIPVFVRAGCRVIAPDLIGFGKSDKPKKEGAHSLTFHRQALVELMDRLNLRNVVLVAHEWGGLVGMTLLSARPDRFVGILAIGPLSASNEAHLPTPEEAAYAAPFPDSGHRAGARAVASMQASDVWTAEATAAFDETLKHLQTRSHGHTVVSAAMRDTMLGSPVMERFRQAIRGCPQLVDFADEAVSKQDVDAALAQAAVDFFSLESVSAQGFSRG